MIAVVAALDAACWAQHDIISTAEAMVHDRMASYDGSSDAEDPADGTINGHFSIQNHRFSGAIPHYLCIFNRKFRRKLAFILQFAVPERLHVPIELPLFTEDNIHVNGDLRVAIMLPVACRPLAARYLVVALAQTALGRIAQRWASTAGDAGGAATHRASIRNALRPWSDMPAPRIRKDNGRALFQLCVALASSSSPPPSKPSKHPSTWFLCCG